MTKKDSKIFKPYYIYIPCALLGMITGVLVKSRFPQDHTMTLPGNHHSDTMLFSDCSIHDG